MFKKILLSFFLLGLFFSWVVPAKAVTNSFVSIVNPVRGVEFWSLKDQKVADSVRGQVQILQKQNLSATFLLRFDALGESSITDLLKSTNFEKGVFLEITPRLCQAAQVNYHQSSSWHNAASVLLTGYAPADRLKLIDADFEQFRKIFGSYPKSVGAWWIDAYSLDYLQKKYGVSGAMIVADQYSTDNYQIWGQYWSTPYYPAKNNALFPAQTTENKINLVMTQWAARDPVNGYGRGVEESTFSIQANDYLDYHNLSTDYFLKLVDTYLNQKFNQFNQVVVGLENSYSWLKYQAEYQKQMESLSAKRNSGQLQIITLGNFANWYQTSFPQLSPDQLVVADDPLNSTKKAVWYMNNFYRVGWIYNNQGSLIRDLRQYVVGQDEICLKIICNEVNFATFATRVLDQVTYGQKISLDLGQIHDLNVKKTPDRVSLTYQNEIGQSRSLEFLPRDISLDGKISTIDGAILDAIKNNQNKQLVKTFSDNLALKSSISTLFKNFVIFSFSFLLLIFLPGLVVLNRLKIEIPKELTLFLASTIGLVLLTVIGFLSQLIFKQFWLIIIWVAFSVSIFFYRKLYQTLRFNLNTKQLVVYFAILLGAIFLIIPTFRSDLEYGYGIGFWGPNGHDGIWHLALINSLVNSVPPQNPILAGQALQNYHYFFDLLAAIFVSLFKIPASDLLFRFLPLIFGLLLGLATVSLVDWFYQGRYKIWAKLLSLYLVYSCGSFGWIVDFIKNRQFNGESAFWASQAISFNLNPPFIVSLLILICLIYLIVFYTRSKSFFNLALVILIGGSLLEFKAYAAILLVLAVGSLLLIRRNKIYLLILVGMMIISILLLWPNYPSLVSILTSSSGTFIFSPFWFIHSMIDSPDRLGLARLALMRVTAIESQNLFKFILAELIGLILFIIGNLGLRVLGLMELKNILRNFSKLESQFIFLISLFSLIIPILFIQKGTPWNTIQFLYYFLFLGTVLTGVWVVNLVASWPKVLSIVTVSLILVISPINSWTVATGYFYPAPHTFISTSELEGLNFLSQQPTGIVLTLPFNKHLKDSLSQPLPLMAYDTTAYVSALAKRSSFIEDEIQQEILGTDYKKRIIWSQAFFLGQEAKDADNFLKNNQIRYIYLPKLAQISLPINQLQISRIFSNNEVEIYRVN